MIVTLAIDLFKSFDCLVDWSNWLLSVTHSVVLLLASVVWFMFELLFAVVVYLFLDLRIKNPRLEKPQI